MEIKIDSTYKGTRILFKETAKLKRELINKMIDILESYGYEEMMIPVIQKSETFAKKVGDENQNMMYNFKDLGDRDLCLAPEYTAVVQLIGKEKFKYQKDVKLFWGLLHRPNESMFANVDTTQNNVLTILREWLPVRRKFKAGEIYAIFEGLLDEPPNPKVDSSQAFQRRYRRWKDKKY